MQSQNTLLIATAVLVLLLITAATSAVYYKNLSVDLESRIAEKEQQAAPEAPVTVAVNTPAVPAAAEAPAADETAALHARIRELELALAQNSRTTPATQTRDEPQGSQRSEQRPRRDYSSWLEDMKKNNPEQYQEMMKRREEAQQRIKNSFAKKAAMVLDRDTTAMGKEEKEEYQLMVQLLDDTWKISERMQQPDLPHEERHQIGHQLFENTYPR